MSRAKRESNQISSELIAGICAVLGKNRLVRKKLPPGGRVHIDRQLPFLCLYRRPPDRADAGTERLLLGEASYLLAEGGRERHGWLKSLIGEIARTQAGAFGAFLILELWAGPESEEGPTFRIHAPEHKAPAGLLAELEKELLEVSLEGHTSSVDICYARRWAPPGLERLFSKRELGQIPAVLLGLEVKPIYRDLQSGELFPFDLKALHHGLGHALKHAFYVFSHDYTSHRPAHYHELGRRAMTVAVGKADERLAEINGRFDILLQVTPVNAEAAWSEFKRSGFEREPEFRYRPRSVDPALLKRQLYQIPLEKIEDPTLAHLFEAKRDEMDRQLAMIEDRGTRRFLRGSQQVFGEIEDGLLALARDLLSRLPPHVRDDKVAHSLDAAAFVRRAEEELAHYRGQDPAFAARVELRDDVFGLMVSRGQFLVGRAATVPEARAEAALAHEVGTHVLTHYNGRTQPFAQLYAGMAKYEALQEGLAVFAEYLVGGLSRPRLRLLAGRVVAVHCLTEGGTFVETFRELHDGCGFNRRTAYMIAMRVHRGGGYTKDAVYLKGLVDLLAYLARGGDLEPLYLGKIAIDYLPFVEELQRRQVLSPGPLRPRYLDRPEAAARLERVRGGLSVVDLVETSHS